MHPIFAGIIADFIHGQEIAMSYAEPNIHSRSDCEYYGIPTGPEPEEVRCGDCWSLKPKRGKCPSCVAREGREAARKEFIQGRAA